MDNLRLLGIDRDKVVPNLSEAELKKFKYQQCPNNYCS